ncbi:hypothetical protein KH486_003964 [Salmonella enterica]|nr:hypothetical protein [Salmonella enterica]
MAKTKSEMFALIGANIPDNTSGAITPEKLREVTTQLADSMLYAAAGVKEVEVLRAPSTVVQAPTSVDTALQLTFGGVYPQTATVAAWGVAPSALLVISRLEPV